MEVDLCGHATLAAAYEIFTYENYKKSIINFNSRSGNLIVRKYNEYLTLDFPTDTIEKVSITEEIKSCFDIVPIEIFKGRSDYMLVFKNEEQIKNIKYDLNKIRNIKSDGIIITARGNECDFVSRYFSPQSGIDEDPVTGSAHTTLTPYWSKILNKDELKAIQLSKRKGYLTCRNKNDRTEISGKARTYMIGEISI